MSDEVDRLLTEAEIDAKLLPLGAEKIGPMEWAIDARKLEQAARRDSYRDLRKAKIDGFMDGLAFAAVCLGVLAVFAFLVLEAGR